MLGNFCTPGHSGFDLCRADLSNKEFFRLNYFAFWATKTLTFYLMTVLLHYIKFQSRGWKEKLLSGSRFRMRDTVKYRFSYRTVIKYNVFLYTVTLTFDLQTLKSIGFFCWIRALAPGVWSLKAMEEKKHKFLSGNEVWLIDTKADRQLDRRIEKKIISPMERGDTLSCCAEKSLCSS